MSLTRSDRLYIKKTLTAENAENAEIIHELKTKKSFGPKELKNLKNRPVFILISSAVSAISAVKFCR